jgi:hypothetical protein
VLIIIIVWCVAFLAGSSLRSQIDAKDLDWAVFIILLHIIVLIGAIGAAIYANV